MDPSLPSPFYAGNSLINLSVCFVAGMGHGATGRTNIVKSGVGQMSNYPAIYDGQFKI